MILKRINLMLVLILISSVSWALPEDSQQEIQITSDSASLDKVQGLIIYSGNVNMTQGTLKIQADKIILTRNLSLIHI